ncbi:MAG: SDR family oxidoreductase [Acidobacteria bacterium]|nr:SDR family oxidoreductase [Acidobacteriota bacterium]
MDGRVAMVTGATRGIGLAVAKGLAARGAKVVISSRKQENVDQALALLDGCGDVAGFPCHVGSSEDLEALVAFAKKTYGDPDILINNAVTNPHFGPMLECGTDAWQKMLDVNLLASLHAARLCIPGMVAKGGGSIINIASIAGLRVYPGMGAYSVLKAALIMATKVLAKELGPMGIRVNAIAPGFVKTQFSEAIWANPKLADPVIKHTPLKRMADPNEIAGLACYLASGESSFTTGSVMVADGGLTL